MPTYVLVPLAISKEKNPNWPLHFVRASYLKKLVKYQLTPLFVSTLMPTQMVDELWQLADGLLLTGGSDLDPKLYGDAKHLKTKIKEPERDRLEMALIQKAKKAKKPVLAICRGAQVVNVAYQGTLIQHLPDLNLDEQHGVESYESLNQNQGHSVKLKPHLRLKAILQQDQVQVKSHHHQAVGRIGPGLKISAVSPAGVVEAIEAEATDHFLIGLQSHPETEVDGDLEPVFAAFAEAVKQYQKKSK